MSWRQIDSNSLSTSEKLRLMDAVVHAGLQAFDDDAPGAQRAVWTAKAQTARSARFVGGQAIQLHGGMGMTDEMAIGHYFKRATMIENQFGSVDHHLRRYERLSFDKAA